MKVMTILGSPKRNGNTAKVLEQFESFITNGHEVDRVDIASYHVKGCVGCYACHKYRMNLGVFKKMMRHRYSNV